MEQESTGLQLVGRKFDFSRDYDTISVWWKEHGSYAPMIEHLPPTGVIVEIDNKPLCAGFLYNTDAKICVVEFVVCDPTANKEERGESLNYLIYLLKKLAIELGYSAIYNSTGIPKMVSRFKEAGFIEADKNQTHMFFFNYETVKD